MIEAVEVVRDKEGGYSHPEWEAFSLSLDDMEIIPGYLLALFEKAHGCKTTFVKFESTVEEDCPAYMEYIDGVGGFKKWELAPPSADAVLLSVHDAEDGPVQLWAVPQSFASLVRSQDVLVSQNETELPSLAEKRADRFEPPIADSILNQPRKVTGHAIDANGRGDMGQAVIAHGLLSPGGAQNHYIIGVGAECELMQGGGVVLGCVSFQDGDPQEVGTNGVTLEAVLAVCADRLERFQDGPHANHYNAEALRGIERALEALKDRTRERDYNAKQGMTPYTQFL